MRVGLASALRAMTGVLTLSLIGIGSSGCASGDKDKAGEEMVVEDDASSAEEAAPKKDKKKGGGKKDKNKKKKKK